jgi:hypothetical protein
MGDVDDPEIYAAPALYKWKQTEQGQWVMEHCADPRYELHPDPSFMGHQVVILGELEDQEATFYQLKWKNANINR